MEEEKKKVSNIEACETAISDLEQTIQEASYAIGELKDSSNTYEGTCSAKEKEESPKPTNRLERLRTRIQALTIKSMNLKTSIHKFRTVNFGEKKLVEESKE